MKAALLLLLQPDAGLSENSHSVFATLRAIWAHCLIPGKSPGKMGSNAAERVFCLHAFVRPYGRVFLVGRKSFYCACAWISKFFFLTLQQVYPQCVNDAMR